ncbi:S-formylglutathione hydrolase [Sulfuriferula plumbiphila]|uniref:S-formylglutathione hydrolase n=1 Tax=Sulfuriferula plumbiphila TaxID=171865 RepID=A0A512L6A3_9PROT|nr:S-formylglutathione hydrolase [Sulfuriferula plumbiphila]BBP03598.1 S-formylglutathione hydrolase [Sulfuriferula plumbiphila]GEP29999.1 S-formylglutathione hydrolase [Sulfuriferula plumbiphila]
MLECISEHACFGGVQGFYRHNSAVIGLPMRFSVYQPPQAKEHPVPVLFYLAGLTCSEETFMIKAGAQRFAARHGIMLVAPDTSPRDTGIAGATDSWDFGEGAGFYVDATQAPWHRHFKMHSYVTQELRRLILDAFPARADRIGVSGHSMGGHGALVLALRNPDIYRSVSAFAPVVAPAQCPWGQKAFTSYLGSDQADWQQYDATELMKKRTLPFPHGILIDQGLDDRFLQEQLLPDEFEAACAVAQQPLTLRRHAGYDHSYYFIATFIEDHLAFHQRILSA